MAAWDGSARGDGAPRGPPSAPLGTPPMSPLVARGKWTPRSSLSACVTEVTKCALHYLRSSLHSEARQDPYQDTPEDCPKEPELLDDECSEDDLRFFWESSDDSDSDDDVIESDDDEDTLVEETAKPPPPVVLSRSALWKMFSEEGAEEDDEEAAQEPRRCRRSMTCCRRKRLSDPKNITILYTKRVHLQSFSHLLDHKVSK